MEWIPAMPKEEIRAMILVITTTNNNSNEPPAAAAAVAAAAAANDPNSEANRVIAALLQQNAALNLQNAALSAGAALPAAADPMLFLQARNAALMQSLGGAAAPNPFAGAAGGPNPGLLRGLPPQVNAAAQRTTTTPTTTREVVATRTTTTREPRLLRRLPFTECWHSKTPTPTCNRPCSRRPCNEMQRLPPLPPLLPHRSKWLPRIPCHRRKWPPCRRKCSTSSRAANSSNARHTGAHQGCGKGARRFSGSRKGRQETRRQEETRQQVRQQQCPAAAPGLHRPAAAAHRRGF